MSKVFSARFDIVGSIATENPGEFDLFGEVVDLSLDGYSVSDIQINDLVFDENLLDGSHNRYKITQIIATGPGSIFGGGGVNSCHLLVEYDDNEVCPVAGPAGGTGAICRSSPITYLSEVPSVSSKGISEGLSTRIRNIDNRYIIDPVLGSVDGSSNNISSTFINNSGSTINSLTPVKNYNGGINKIDVSSENDISNCIGILNNSTNDGNLGIVTSIGLIKNITTDITIDSVIFISKTGFITNVVPDIGVGDFTSGDFVVCVGKIIKSSSNPLEKDFYVDIDIRGQL